MKNKDLLKALKEEFNGCPLFEGRTKESMDALTDKVVTIDTYFAMSDYHAVVFKEFPSNVFLSGGGLKTLLNKYGANEALVGLQIKVLPMIKTADRHDFRPIEIVDFEG